MSLLSCLLFVFLQVPSFNGIKNKIAVFQNSPGVKGSTVAVSVKNCRTGNFELMYNEDKLVNSASTLKLVTTATALEVLGKDFRYQTFFSYSGAVVNNKLNGNLYISGSGDPAFGSARWGKNYEYQLTSYLQSVRNAGISEITGDVVLMKSGVEDFDVADTWAWNDLGNYYGATPFLFNFNENMFTAYFEGGTTFGDATVVKTMKPLSTSWRIFNKVTTAERGSGDNVYMYSTPLNNVILMKGTIPVNAGNFAIRGSIPNPALAFGELLYNKLTENGIPVGGSIRLQSNLSTDLKLLSVESSPPLSELAASCNYFSINLVADALLKKMGEIQSGKFSYETGIASVKNFWKKRGVDVTDLNIKDGSGLSPSGTISARVMTDILASESTSINFNTFISTIPKLGVSGTVAGLGRGTKAQGKVWVKSGSIDATRAYAGYFKTADGELMSFMIVVNRYNDNAKSSVRKFLEETLVDFGSL